MQALEFEKTILEVEDKIEELRHMSSSEELDVVEEMKRLETKLKKQVSLAYKKLTPLQKTQVARHENRPHTTDYIHALITDFIPLCGDRCFAEDEAIITGMGRFQGRTVMIMGHEKGRDMESRLKHNFGAARPEGYRKVSRLLRMAERFGIPVISFVDTAGAFPGVEGEERGQAEAIATAMDVSFDLTVPVIAVIIGEGGSGGAIAMATANTVLMLSNSIYSVISPEGCASILWKDATKADKAAMSLCLTVEDLLKHKIVDEEIKEPLGGAHRYPKETIMAVGTALGNALKSFDSMTGEIIKKSRQNKFLQMTRNG